MKPVEDIVTLPRPVLTALTGISASHTNRMHELLDKNTEGTIDPGEKRELELLVQLAQIDQVITLALQLPT